MFYLCIENKGAVQLRSDRIAYLRLCFCICKKQVFSCWAHMLIIANTPLNKASVFAIMSVSLPLCLYLCHYVCIFLRHANLFKFSGAYSKFGLNTILEFLLFV